MEPEPENPRAPLKLAMDAGDLEFDKAGSARVHNTEGDYDEPRSADRSAKRKKEK